jgi:hypothetical protein
MSRLTLQDSRRLKFTVPALLDAALTFDREHNGWLWRASAHSLVIDAGGTGAVTIRARKSGATEPETVNRSPAWVAAALLQYCFKRRIPIPRNGTKTISVLPDGLLLLVEVAMQLAPLELSRDVLDAAERQGVSSAPVASPSMPPLVAIPPAATPADSASAVGDAPASVAAPHEPATA